QVCALPGAAPEIRVVLHHQLRGEEHARERVVGRLLRLLLGLPRGDGAQGEGHNEMYRTRFHGVLRSESMVVKPAPGRPGRIDGRIRPTSGTVRNSSSPGSTSRKSVGPFQRTLARSIVLPCRSGRINSSASATPATTTAAVASQPVR